MADLFDIALARKLSGGGGGGGGSSDFSTAEVTLINKEGYIGFGLYDPGYDEAPYGYHCCHIENGQIMPGGPVSIEEPQTFTLYYLGDSLEIQPNNAYESSTGAVTWNPDTYTLTITGDCTITGYLDD